MGEVEVQRLPYQAPGVDGNAPLDAALGLPDEKYTHDLRRIVAEESAKSSFDEVVELVAKRTGGSVPKRRFQRAPLRSTALTGRGLLALRLKRMPDADDLVVPCPRNCSAGPT